MTPMQKLTLEILNDCMSIVEKRVSNPVYKKALKDEIDFSNGISEIKVPEFLSKQVGEYF